jgi:hypothetical protein
MTFLLESSVHKWGLVFASGLHSQVHLWGSDKKVFLNQVEGNIRGVEANHNGLCLVLDFSEVSCIPNR